MPKRYRVKVWKQPNERQLNRIRKGIQLEDGRTKPAKVRVLESTDSNNTWLELTLNQGKNRTIRQMFDAINQPVSKLQRTSFATITLGRLEPKQYRPLSGPEIERLRAIAEGTDPKSLKKFTYKKGFARPKKKKSPLRKKKQKR